MVRTRKPNFSPCKLQDFGECCVWGDWFFLSFFLWLHLHWANDGAGQGNAVVGLGADNAREKLVEVENGVDEGNVVGHHNWSHLLAGWSPNATNPVKPATTSKGNPLWAPLLSPKTLVPKPYCFLLPCQVFLWEIQVCIGCPNVRWFCFQVTLGAGKKPKKSRLVLIVDSFNHEIHQEEDVARAGNKTWKTTLK